jgi:hypothetical protein
MPRRRRNTRATRRNPKRPDFAAGPQQPQAQPEPEERVDREGNPIFADEVATADASEAYTGPGPVETRPAWIDGPAQRRRQPGRRTAQLRQRGSSEGAARIMAGQLPTFERSYIVNELRLISVISTTLFAVIVVLAVVMR